MSNRPVRKFTARSPVAVEYSSESSCAPAPAVVHPTPGGRSSKTSNETLPLFGDEQFNDEERLTCGVDEAGRGPLAGAVFAAAVILDPARPIEGLRDSKKLTAAQRNHLMIEIKKYALCWSVAQASEKEIDQINILQATMLAMQRAVHGLSIKPDLALIDGNRCPQLLMATQAIVQGDDIVPAISAASILAKTARDAALIALHHQFPQYGFDQHKGYATALHLERLREHGVSPVHRLSFAPVRELVFIDTMRL